MSSPSEEQTHNISAAAASVRKFQKELSAGIISLALLSLLANAKEPLYGYQIAKDLEGFASGPPVKQGTLYPVLRSLEASQLVISRVEPSISGPPRRYYSITDEGQHALELWKSIWNSTREFIDAVLEENNG